MTKSAQTLLAAHGADIVALLATMSVKMKIYRILLILFILSKND